MLARILALLSIAGFVVSAEAGAPDPNGKIKVTLVVVLASEEPGSVDPRLKAIAAEVRNHNPSLQSFRLKEMTSKSLDLDEKRTFDLVEGKSAQVVVRRRADKDNRVELAVTAPDQGEIVYRTVCGKFVPIVTRCQTKARERLILAIRVQPCMGD